MRQEHPCGRWPTPRPPPPPASSSAASPCPTAGSWSGPAPRPPTAWMRLWGSRPASSPSTRTPPRAPLLRSEGLARRGVRVEGDDAGREPKSLIQAVGGLGAGPLQLPAVGQGEAAEELAGGGGGRGVGHRPQGCSCLIGPQPLYVAEVASPGEHALGHRHHELTQAEPTAPGLQVAQAGIDPLDEPDAGNQLPCQGQAGMSGEGGVVVARVQLGAGRGSIHLQGASCLWDSWLFSDYHYPSSGGTFLIFQARKSCYPSSVTRGSKSDGPAR